MFIDVFTLELLLPCWFFPFSFGRISSIFVVTTPSSESNDEYCSSLLMLRVLVASSVEVRCSIMGHRLYCFSYCRLHFSSIWRLVKFVQTSVSYQISFGQGPYNSLSLAYPEVSFGGWGAVAPQGKRKKEKRERKKRKKKERREL